MSISRIKLTKGFTLIELMIVVAIIGILAAVAIPKFADLVTKSKEASVKGSLGAVRSALSIYYGDTEGGYPGNIFEGLTTGAKYLPNQGGTPSLGAFTVPPNNKGNPGHSNSLVTQGNVQDGSDSAVTDETKALRYINSGTRLGEVFIACTHNDTKGLRWTGY